MLDKNIIVNFNTLKDLRTIEDFEKSKSFDREKFDEIVNETRKASFEAMNESNERARNR